MNAATPHPRGTALILEHCARLNEDEETRSAAGARLRQAIGEELTRLLLRALAGDHRARLRVI